MPRQGGGVYNPGKGDTQSLNGVPSAATVKGKSAQKRGPSGHPSTGRGSPSSPAAAAAEGAEQARKPRT